MRLRVDSFQNGRRLMTGGVVRGGELEIGGSRTLIFVWCVLAIGLIVPLLVTPILPSNDLFFHSARMEVLVRPDARFVDEWYQPAWSLIPNLAMDLIVPPLASVVGILAAVRIFMGFTLILLFGGTAALHYSVYRKLSWFPLISCLFIYNHIVIFGFANYLFGIALTLWALAAWFSYRSAPTGRLLVATMLAPVLYVCHLYAVALYGFVLGTAEIPKIFAQKSGRNRARELGLLIVPFIIPAVLFEFFGRQTGGEGLGIEYFSFKTYVLMKLLAFFTPFVTNYPAYDVLLALLTAGFIFYAIISKTVEIHRDFRLALGLLLVVVFALPTGFMGGYLADLRTPIAIIFLAIAACRFRPSTPRLQMVTSCIVVVFFIIRVTGLSVDFYNAGVAARDIERAFIELKPNSVLFTGKFDHVTLLTAEFKQDRFRSFGARPNTLPMEQISTAALLTNAVFVPETLMIDGQQPARMLNPYSNLRRIQGDGVHPWLVYAARDLYSNADVAHWLGDIRNAVSSPEYHFSATYVALIDPEGVATRPLGVVEVFSKHGYRIWDITNAKS